MKNLLRRASFAVFCIMLFSVGARGQQTVNVPAELAAYPDLILHNGKIVTMDDASFNDSPGSIFEALAVRGDQIQFLGSSAELLRYAGPQTRTIDLKGRTVVPGLIDTHNHLHNGAVSRWVRDNMDIVEPIVKRFSVAGQTFGELTRGIELIIKENMSNPLPDQWAMIGIEGGATGIGYPYLLQDQLTRDQLDEWAPVLPVLVQAGPGAWLLNTAARDDFLEYYSVPPTDANEETAITMATIFGRGLIADRYFDTHLNELVDAIEDQLKHQAAGGFTTYSSHIVGLRMEPAFRVLVKEGRMPMRLAWAHRLCQHVEPDNAGCFLRTGDWSGMGNDYFWNVGLTLGGIDAGPPTICTTMDAPEKYKSQEKCIIQPGNAYYNAVQTAFRTRYRYVVNHLYGDKGLDYVMDIMEQVVEENPDITMDFMRSMRVTSDHCGLYPRPEQLPRMRRLGIILSCNPNFINRSTPWLDVYGWDKANRISPVGGMIKAGVMPTAEYEGLNYGSGGGITPTTFLSYFLHRTNARGQVVGADEAIDRVSAMKMTTVWASFYVLKEKELGTLETGKWADFTVFSKDYFTIPEEEIPTVIPLMTVLGGKTMSLREEFATELGVDPVGPQLNFEFERDYDFGAPLM